jgi:hypothetical protein
MPGKRLRAVQPDEVAKPKRKKTMAEAANDGDNLALYLALRSKLVEALNDARTPQHALAPIARQIAQCTESIDRLQLKAEIEEEEEQVPTGDEPWTPNEI